MGFNHIVMWELDWNNALHLFSFKTPTSWADLSEEGDADCALEMRNGVKCDDI